MATRPRSVRQWAHWLAPALVGLVFLVLYLRTLIVVHRFDAVGYVMAAKNPDPRSWFHPHHLLYPWLGHILQGIVGPDRVTVALQSVSALAAATALAIYVVILWRLVRPHNRVWPFLGAVLLGVSASFWVSSVESDPYALTLASLIAASACYLRAAETGNTRWHLLAGFVAALGMLVHQIVVLFALAYALALVFTARRRLESAFVFLVPQGLFVTLVYLAVGLTHGFFRDVPGLLRWLTTYAHQGFWGPDQPRIVEGLYGFLYAFAAGAGGLIPSVAVKTVAVILLIVGAWAGRRYVRAIARSRSSVAMAALCFCWIGIFAPFIVWFAAFYTTHWQFVIVPLLMLGVCAVDRIGASPTAPRARRLMLTAVMVLVCVVVGALNYVRVIRPLTLADHDVEQTFVRSALARLPAGARVVAPIGVPTLFMLERLGSDAVFIVPHRPARDETLTVVLGRLRWFLDAAWRENRPVGVFMSLLQSTSDGYLTDPTLSHAVSNFLRGLADDPRVLILDTTPIRALRAP